MRIKIVSAVVGAVLAGLLSATPVSAATQPHIDNASLYGGGLPCFIQHPPVLNLDGGYLQAVGTASAAPAGQLTNLQYQFAIWPSADPADTTVLRATTTASGALATAVVPVGLLHTGVTYTWRVQLSDGHATSPRSRSCSFTHDSAWPAAPVVNSPNFPNPDERGPIGRKVTFDFSDDSPDVAGFVYTWVQGAQVFGGCTATGPQGQLVCSNPLSLPNAARAQGAARTARVSLTPPGPNVQVLTVTALDRAGNASPSVRYQVQVPFSWPIVTRTPDQPADPALVRVALSPFPGVRNVVAYRYSDGQGDPTTVPAAADGTARVDVPVPAGRVLRFTSVSRDGFESSVRIFQVEDDQ